MKVDENTVARFRKAVCDAGFWELEERIQTDEIMKNHISFRVGGPAQLYVEPSDLREVIALVQSAKKSDMPYFLMGNGSNLVISDEGIDGLVIRLGDKFSSVWVEEDKDDKDVSYLHAYAGALLTKVSSTATKYSLSGLEFASGIPGSVGGAVFMNAGAYNHDMSEIVDQALCITDDGETFTLTGDEFEYGYRTSRFMSKGGIVLTVVLKLHRGDQEEITKQIREYTEKRTSSQPLNFPSAGSMFKRPEGHYTGALIQEAGLKGVSVGGAQVSEKHAGFVINTGNATAKDIADLVKLIQKTVKENSGVMLEREVRFIGRGFSQ
ncbi:MAG: UDP-N-acetylmuramate dehydrogenase [Clostridiales bacterium]|nr:UDP-N-acetylmuramate dehydrogenase [Clostridiales bacterium]